MFCHFLTNGVLRGKVYGSKKSFFSNLLKILTKTLSFLYNEFLVILFVAYKTLFESLVQALYKCLAFFFFFIFGNC